MRPHIVAGYDGSPGSRDALVLALALLDRQPERAGELTVVSVSAGDVYGLHPGRSHATYERALAAQALAHLAGAREKAGTRASVSFAVRRDTSPAQALHALAKEYAASSIVVGRSHAGLVGRLFQGSVTEQTLHGAPCPVYVAPVGYASSVVRRTIDRIAVGVDGSPTSLVALSFAARLARRNGAALRLLRVLEPQTVPYGGADPVHGALADRRSAALAELRAHGEHLDGVSLELVVEVGDPASVLRSPGRDVDLLVAGSRDFGPADAVLLGGVSSKVARACTVPMVVVPRAPERGRDSSAGRFAEATR